MNLDHCLAITTTIDPCSIPVSIGSNSSIFLTTSAINSYTYEYFPWVSPVTGSVTLAFQFRNDPSNWYMDDVSVFNGTNEMLVNGGFESGSLSPGWTASTPNGNCAYGFDASVTNSYCHNGTYCLSDGCYGVLDEISQSFVAISGQSYFISFWLQSSGGSGIFCAGATLS
jgi:hypothetical protein